MFVKDQQSLFAKSMTFMNEEKQKVKEMQQQQDILHQTGGAPYEQSSAQQKRYDFMLQEQGVESVVKTVGML